MKPLHCLLVVCLVGWACDDGEAEEPAAPPEVDQAAEEQVAETDTPAEAEEATEEEAAEEEVEIDPESILGRIQANENLSTYLELAGTVGFVEDIRDSQGITVLAPNNAAFEALGDEELAALRSDRKRLRNLMANHVLMGTMRTRSLRDREEQGTLSQGRDTYPITTANDQVKIGDATLVEADIECPNGILHVTDAVLMPESFDPDRRGGPFGVNLWVLDEE